MDKETSEIGKLTERISKDPKSKLFVPLAEEYKKAGDIEMAIHVLTEGLKHNPGYVTARSILGRLLLENGDLAGSQNELEEVVKAIPDNLLAQRKLGDICILQNKPNEALRHYKSVRSLNPRDNEIVSLISDIEAGRDVRPRIPQPKPQPSPPEEPVKQETKQQPQTAPVQQAQAIRGSASATTPPVQVSRAEEPETAKTPTVAPAPVSHAAVETEEPEEVLVVEPLEKESPEQESHAAVFDFLTEQSHEATHAPSAEEPPETLFALTDQVREEPTVSERILAEPNVFDGTETEKTQQVAAEKQAEAGIVEAEIVEAEILEETPAVRPVKVSEKTLEKSDDFTTDTLAELYIAQGFYEKAIDIYERMLAENPNSRGLKDKLDGVKAMAAASTAPAPAEEEKKSEDIFAEPQVYRAQKKPTEEKKETDLFAEPGEYTPAAETAERPPAGIAEGTDEFMPPPAQKFTRAKPLFTDFEPREYMPPKAEEHVETKAEKVHAAPQSSRASRKETIDRLESWLKNIKKEK